MNKEKWLIEDGWRIEWMKCPVCGNYVASKLGKDGEIMYSCVSCYYIYPNLVK